MKEFERCKSCLTDKQKIRLPVVMTVKKLENFAQEYHGCAYLTARELLSEFNVITGHYNYFLNKDIKKAVGMEEEKSILILDEGHNLEEVLTDQYSSILSNYIMQNAQKEVNSVDYQLLSSLNNLNNSIELFISTHGKINEDIHFEGEKMTEYFRSYGINESRLNALESRFYIMKESLLNKQREKLGYFPSSLMTEEVITFFSMKELQPKDVGYIFTKLPKGYRIRKVCLNPALAFTEIRKQSLAIIICSGTLSPLSLWQEILGIEQISKIAKYGTLTDPRRVKIVAFSHDKHNNILTTKYSHRIKRKEIYGDYLQAIAELVTINLDNGGILLFAPSYDFLNSISLPTNYGRVKCFIETQDAKESQNMLDDYVNSIKSGQKALFAGVLGGKLSEGMDLPQELVRMVVIIGIPYPPPNDPVIQLKRHYYDENIRKGLGNDWYNAQAYRKVSQALGRGWRTTNDYSIGILLDNRFTFTSSIDQLPLWIKNNLHLAKDWSDGIRTVNSFFQKVKDLEN
jgi:Rad3-related DNA helicase